MFLMAAPFVPTKASKDKSAHQSDTMTVVGSANTFRAGGNEWVPTYLDGQVAHGGRIGFLGQQEAGNLPFNVIGYTAKMIADQQANTLADVVKNDASVQNVRGFGNAAETYRIRGFKLDSDDISFGGLYGVMPRQIVSTQMIERVEVFKGANAFINGIAPGGSGVGGAINLEPKRADDLPLTRVTIDYGSTTKMGGALDMGRRFGDNNQFGSRFNLLHSTGESAIHHQREGTTLASIGLDYRGDRSRTSLDMGHQQQRIEGGRGSIALGNATAIPSAPATRLNYSQRWVYTDLKTHFAMLRSEYDVTDNWTVYGSLGSSRNEEQGEYGNPKLMDNQGNATITRMNVPYIADIVAAMGGIRGQFTTAFVTHQVNFGYMTHYRKTKSDWNLSAPVVSHIYQPVEIDYPSTKFGNKNTMPTLKSQARAGGFALSDTLSVLDEKVLLTLGVRRQEVAIRNYNHGVEDNKSALNAMKVTPLYGIVLKPWKNFSLYANHIEALQPGSIAPFAANNRGYVTDVVHSKQNELGVKFDNKRVGGTLALFEISKPVGLIDPVSNNYGLYGEQRNRGIELNVFGEPIFGVRILAGAVWMDPKLTKTNQGKHDGNNAIGVPRYQLVFGSEYDISGIEGLTINGAVIRSGSQYVNASNTLKLTAWTRLDLGLRYATTMNTHDLVWRVNVENVTNERYWASVDDSGTYITQGDPRTLKLSVAMDF